MKWPLLILVLPGTLLLKAEPVATNNVPAPAATKSTAAPAAPADNDAEAAAPGEGFPAKRYEALWTKSPFAVETPEAEDGEESPDYSLVGVAQLDGIFYASVIEKQNQEHFLVSSDKPYKGLTLTSISHGHGATDTTASFIKDGQPIVLKLEQAPMTPQPAVPGMPNISLPTPGVVPQNIPMPGVVPERSGMPVRPLIRIHRPAIHLPPRVEPQQPPVPAPSK